MRDPNLRMLSNVCCWLEVCLRSDLEFDREMVRKSLNHLMELSVSYKVNKMVQKTASHTASPTASPTASRTASPTASRTASPTASPTASHTASPKENENEKENLPPTPPIREKEKEKESRISSLARARARAVDPNEALTIDEARLLRQSGSCNPSDHELLIHYQTDIPTMERVKKHFALYHPEETDTAFIDEWFKEMDSTSWINPRNDKATHWAHSLEAWFKNKAVKKAIRDPERISDVRKFKGKSGSGGEFHASNYIPPEEGRGFFNV